MSGRDQKLRNFGIFELMYLICLDTWYQAEGERAVILFLLPMRLRPQRGIVPMDICYFLLRAVGFSVISRSFDFRVF